MATQRFNLRNASLYLNKLKNKYQKVTNEDENLYDNTFIDEEDELNSNLSVQKLSSKKMHSQRTDQQESYHAPQMKQNQQSLSPQATQTIQYENQQQQKQQSQQTQFCDLIVIKYLEQTLAIYKADLDILQHNRDNLEQQIYFIGKKIGKFHQMVAQNAAMTLQIQNLNQNLKQMIFQYHQSKKRVFMKKISLTKVFQKHQHKLKQFLLFDKKTHSDADFYLKPDCQTSSYLDQYTDFINFKKDQSSQINNSLKNPEISQKLEKTFAKKLFQGKQQVYFPSLKQNKFQINLSAQLKQYQLQESQKKKEKKVVLYDQLVNDEEQFGLKSKESKGKKMTQAQKNSLLGDLKKFSKSFKIPQK